MELTVEALCALSNDDDDGPILGDYDLASECALMVAQRLAQNWVSHVRCNNGNIQILLTVTHDVDEVIGWLQEWKARVRQAVTDGTFRSEIRADVIQQLNRSLKRNIKLNKRLAQE